jgi:hypothetical protein
MPIQQAGEPGFAKPLERMWVGVAFQHHQRGLGQRGAQDVGPERAEQLQQRIQALQGGGAALDQVGAQPHRPPERLGRSQPVDRSQPIRV